MNKIFYLTKPVGIIFFIFLLDGCASIHAYMYVLAGDYDGKAVLEKEGAVTAALEQIIENADQYTMKAYERTAISYKIRKTKDTTHSFYVIACEDKTYQTLSFSATGIWATSEGAWSINTDSDIFSYEDYLSGENKWDVEEIKTGNKINTLRTTTNVLAKIKSGITYYFRAGINKDDLEDNCNSALLETIEAD